MRFIRSCFVSGCGAREVKWVFFGGSFGLLETIELGLREENMSQSGENAKHYLDRLKKM